jgi:predicted aspartyl protease
MIQGVVSENGEPTIPLQVASVTCRVIVDTGFNGDLQLPAEFRNKIPAEYAGRTVWLLANNETLEEDTFLVQHRLTVDFVQRAVQITRSESVSLLGR